uniref:Glycoside hydrolase family 38 N-terminal domain-containing protein n=1 Tax=Glossina brevipalpis TaxID=37001 RepID=A0A1A9W6T6_9MUSC
MANKVRIRNQFAVVLLWLLLTVTVYTKASTNCGYKSCPVSKKNLINVHLVPHSHDDVGWLKTVDEYYYGTRTIVQRAHVEGIIDTVVEELLKDERRR